MLPFDWYSQANTKRFISNIKLKTNGAIPFQITDKAYLRREIGFVLCCTTLIDNP